MSEKSLLNTINHNLHCNRNTKSNQIPKYVRAKNKILPVKIEKLPVKTKIVPAKLKKTTCQYQMMPVKSRKLRPTLLLCLRKS